MRPAILLAITATLFSPPLPAQTCAGPQTFLFGGAYETAHGVSADGSVVVGRSELATGQQVAFRWTESGGMQNLGTLGGAHSGATGVTDDGSVVVGTSRATNNDWHAFRWTAAGGMQDLGTLGGGTYSLARGVNADGSVVVGNLRLANGDGRAFRWTPTGGMQDLGTLGGASSDALGVNADGSVVVGFAETVSGSHQAFRWTSAGGMQGLGTLACGTHSIANAVSDDGTVIVGDSGSGIESCGAFRWTVAGGMQELGALGRAFGVSADGTVVVGESGQGRAARWTAAGGMQDLDRFVPVPNENGSQAYDVSADGSVVVGLRFYGLSPASSCCLEFGAFRIQSSILGETYCRSTVENSTGCSGIVLANGDPRLVTGSLEVTATLLPQHTFGFFLTSQAQDLVLAAGGSQGNLCLGGAIGRFVGPGQVMNSGASGSFVMTVNLNAMPAPTLSGTVAVQPGDTWNFQAWHRDTNPGPTSNFTDAVSITFL